MPERKLTDPERRSLTLAALSGQNVAKLSAEYGVSRSHVYKLMHEAREKAWQEYEFWRSVVDTIEKEEG